MRKPDHRSISVALAKAGDAEGAGRLLALLGYRLISPPAGVPVEVGAERCTHVASGAGIEAIVVDAGGTAAGSAARASRIRGIVGVNPRPVILLCPDADSLTLASGGLDGRTRVATVSRLAPRASEVELLLDLAPRDEAALATIARHARALDRSALTRRFFRDFRAYREVVSDAWLGVPSGARADRDQLALLFLSRLLFLYFLQRQGHLLGREDYLVTTVRDASSSPAMSSIFVRTIQPLFFGVLNRPIAERSAQAAALGELPYLNGGLFEPHALERRYAGLDLPDEIVLGAFDRVFERYRFTASESRNGGTGGIEPEMLGRMFEGLMPADRRGRTGTFYTPAPVVDRIVRKALQGWLAGRPGMDWRGAGMLLREPAAGYTTDPVMLQQVQGVRVVDPACGSGAFVLGALDRLSVLRARLGDPADRDAVRRDLAANSIHGVDVEADAALLCALRLWLALTPACADVPVRPLPSLDHRVRQGDALLDPVDLAARGDAAAEVWRAAALDGGVRRARRALTLLVQQYGAVTAAQRDALRARIGRAEVRLARRWVRAGIRRVNESRRLVHAAARERDLFGERGTRARARREIARLRDVRIELNRLERRLRDESALPFFSFMVHFGAGEAGRSGFDLVVSNPPWVRSHRWPRAFANLLRARYRVCRADRGTRSGASVSGGGQVDLALLFLERALGLLAPEGVLALLLPSKAFRSQSAGSARALLREESTLLCIEDHALHHRAIFRGADAFAGVVVARAAHADAAAQRDMIRVTMTHRASAPLKFRMPADELSLRRGDAAGPWLLVPPDVRRALRAMQRYAVLADDARLNVRRGVMTGANDALLFERAERKLGDAAVAWPSAATRAALPPGSVLLHPDDLCPIVRGAGIRPFRYETDGFIAWCHDDDSAKPRAPSRRLARFLEPNRQRLRARPGWRSDLPDGALFRLDATMLGPRVAWRDIAADLEVTRLPAREAVLGTFRPLIALNTVYFLPLPDDDMANALVALLSSLPCRVFARSVAERAKDARFRFFAWTLGSIPLPSEWTMPGVVTRLAALGERAQELASRGASLEDARAEIDELSFTLYGLSARHAHSLRRFDAWLRGVSVDTHPTSDLMAARS